MAPRLLVRATNWVGDAVMSLPALQALRKRFPDAHIAILARPWVADLYAREPFCDEIILHDVARGGRDLRGLWTLARRLRAGRFDTAVLLQNAFEAALLAWLARIPQRIGYDRDGRGLLLTQAVPVPRPVEVPRHERFYYLELLRRAGLLPSSPADDSVRLHGAEVARQAGRARLVELGLGPRVVGVSPGAAYGTAKRYPPDRFAAAAAAVASSQRADIALFGSSAERALCEEVRQLLPGQRVVNLAGQTTLREFIDCAAACAVFLTNDSGSMHVASALGVPTVAVFGATDDTTTGPTSPLARVVREPVECSPCLLRDCPIDHRCMTRVDPARVARTALELIE